MHNVQYDVDEVFLNHLFYQCGQNVLFIYFLAFWLELGLLYNSRKLAFILVRWNVMS